MSVGVSETVVDISWSDMERLCASAPRVPPEVLYELRELIKHLVPYAPESGMEELMCDEPVIGCDSTYSWESGVVRYVARPYHCVAVRYRNAGGGIVEWAVRA
jgi:hypothetical protein